MLPSSENSILKRQALPERFRSSISMISEPSTVSIGMQGHQSKGIKNHGSTKTKRVKEPSHFSNCSTISDYLNLGKITEEDDFHDG